MRIPDSAVAAPETISFECFGLRGELAAERGALGAPLTEALPSGARLTAPGTGVRFTVRRDGSILRDGNLVDVPDHVTDPLTRLALAVRHHVAEHAPDHVFLHAGVVAVDGIGVVIPGSTMSGKSVLVEELVRAGALYYSDEYAAIDRAGRIHPYPKPIVLRPGTMPFGPIALRPDQIGHMPLEARLLVVTRYEPFVEWQPREMTPAEAALALLEHAVPGRSRPRQALQAITGLARGARALCGPRGEAGPVARAVLAAAAAPKRSPTGALSG